MKLLALLAAGAALAGSSAPRPALRAADLDPLTLRGSSFKPSERVKLLVAAPASPITRTIRATARGTFRIVLPLAVGRCEAVTVQAFGARGSRATFRHDALDCVEP